MVLRVRKPGLTATVEERGTAIPTPSLGTIGRSGRTLGGNLAMGHRLLARIDGPDDLKTLTRKELTQLAQEVRDTIVSVIIERGGHLASNLGVVELTLALHRIFDSPTDSIVWDTTNQTYTHKMVTVGANSSRISASRGTYRASESPARALMTRSPPAMPGQACRSPSGSLPPRQASGRTRG